MKVVTDDRDASEKFFERWDKEIKIIDRKVIEKLNLELTVIKIIIIEFKEYREQIERFYRY